MINYFPHHLFRCKKKSLVWFFVSYVLSIWICARFLWERNVNKVFSAANAPQSAGAKTCSEQKNNFRRTSTNFQLSKYEDKIFYHQASKNPKMLKESYIQSSQKLLWRKNPWKQVISIAKYSWRGKSDYTEKCRSGLPPSLS